MLPESLDPAYLGAGRLTLMLPEALDPVYLGAGRLTLMLPEALDPVYLGAGRLTLMLPEALDSPSCQLEVRSPHSWYTVGANNSCRLDIY